MPAISMLQIVEVVQTPVVEPPLVSMAATLEPETESRHCNRHKHKEISGRLNSEKELT